MHKPMLSTAYWLTFNPETRFKLIRLFDINKSGGAIVETIDGRARVISDGHSADDLTAINIDVLQKILATKSTDFFSLLQHVVEGIDKFLEIKDSGAVDREWNFTQLAKSFDSEEKYKVSEPLEIGDLVRIKGGEIYKIGRAAGRPKKHEKQEAGA